MGERVKLNDIWETFVKQDGSEKKTLESTAKLTASLLQDTVPDMRPDQAQRTLNNSMKAHEQKTTKPFEIDDSLEPLIGLDDATKLTRDTLFHAYDRADYFDTMLSDAERDASDMDQAMADLVAQEAEAATENTTISGQVLGFVEAEIQRLSAETANVLAQTVRSVDRRQQHIEKRQAEMLTSIRQMRTTLLNLQSEGLSLMGKMQRIHYERQPDMPGAPSTWRKTKQGTVLPPCLDCGPDAQEAPLPGVRRSGTGML